jgi:ubiquinone/menaquinone biosynthesis C-methylase UbiE
MYSSRNYGRPPGCVWAPLYDRVTQPLERAVLAERRARMLNDLSGVIVEAGAGTGANLEHFRAASQVIATEPDPRMRRQFAAKLPGAPVPVELLDAPAESLPGADASADAVVFTCVLCTVADVDRALAEARRVLKPTGRLVVLEHVRGTGRLARWQDRITPVWARLMGGCHPNRDIAGAITNAGFTFEHAEHFDPFPRLIPARPMLQATARPAAATAGETSPSSQRPRTSRGLQP